jgi:hypothetical protein
VLFRPINTLNCYLWAAGQLASQTDVGLALAFLEFPLIALLSRPLLAPPPNHNRTYGSKMFLQARTEERTAMANQVRPGQARPVPGPGPSIPDGNALSTYYGPPANRTTHPIFLSCLPSIRCAPLFCPYRLHSSFRALNLAW